MPAMTTLWVTRTVGVANARFTRSSASSTSTPVLLSSAPVGSSHRSSRRLLCDRRARRRRAAARRRKAAAGKRSLSSAMPTRASASVGGQRPLGADGSERHVLAGRQARDEVVGLKDEADVPAPVEGQCPLVERGKVGHRQTAGGRRSARSRPPMRLSSVDLPLPEGPSRTTKSPRASSKSTPRRAWRDPPADS